MDNHRSQYKHWKAGNSGHIRSYDLFDKYGIDNCQILLIELYPCLTKDELRSREGNYISTIKCINKNLAGRTKNQYRQDNIDTIKNNQKQYQQDHADTITKNRKQYYELNRDKMIEQITCQCGGIYSRVNYSRHCKSKSIKHILIRKMIKL